MKRSTTLVTAVTICFFILASAVLIPIQPKIVFAADKVIELKMGIEHGTKAGKYLRGHVPWTEAVEKATNGKVKVTIYPSNSLSKSRERVDATIDGIMDIGWLAVVHFPNRFPLTEILQMPGLGFADGETASKVSWNIYKKFPEIQAEWKDVKVLFFHALAPMVLGSADKRVTKVEDVKGMKLRAAGKAATALYKAAGASPTYIPAPDIYLSMERGVVDGAVIGWEAIRSFGVDKVSDYTIPVYAHPSVLFAVIMNKEKWNSLPPDIQKEIESVCGDFAAELYGKGDDVSAELTKKGVLELGKEILEWDPGENEKWMVLAKEISDSEITILEEKGLPARNVYDEIVRQLAQ